MALKFDKQFQNSGAYPNCLFYFVAIPSHTEMLSILPGLSAKLDWTSEEASYSQDESRVTPFQMTFEAGFVVGL